MGKFEVEVDGKRYEAEAPSAEAAVAAIKNSKAPTQAVGGKYQPGVLSDDPAYWPPDTKLPSAAEQKPKGARGIVVPLAEDEHGKVGLGVPGLIHDPIEGFQKAQAGLAQGRQPHQVAGPAFEAASAIQPGTGFARPPVLGPAKVAVPKPPPVAFDPNAQAGKFVSDALRKDAGVAAGDVAGTAAAAEAQKKIQAGEKQDVRTMDVGGEETRSLLRASSNFAPAGKGAVQDMMATRSKEGAQRMATWLREAMGNPQEAHLTLDKLREAAKSPTTAAYNQAFADGSKGVTSPILERIMSSQVMEDVAKQGHQSYELKLLSGRTQGEWRASRTDKAPFTLEAWDHMKRVLDGEITQLKRAGNETKAADLNILRKQIVEEMDTQVPSYAKARGEAAKIMNAGDAVEAGQEIAKSRMTKTEIEKIHKASSPEEWGRVQMGWLDEYTRATIFTPDRADIVKRLANSQGEREKIEAMLGPKMAKEFQTVLMTEELIGKAKQALGNSTTAGQAQAMSRYQIEPQGANRMRQAVADYGSKNIVQTIKGWMTKRTTERVARETEEQNRQVHEKVLEMLMSKDPAQYYKAIEGISRNAETMSWMRQLVRDIPKFPTSVDRQLPRALGEEGERQKRDRKEPLEVYIGRHPPPGTPLLPGEVGPMGTQR